MARIYTKTGDTGKTALKAERDPMLETELDRLLQLARG